MIINTVETSYSAPAPRRSDLFLPARCRWSRISQGGPLLATLLTLCGFCAFASPSAGPWTPIYKGVALASGTNNPNVSGNFPRLQVARCVRVDLSDPDVQLLSTPPASSYVADYSETLTQTVPHFLQQNALQVACDANFYSASQGGSDPPGEGIACEVYGLQVSEGAPVSANTYNEPDPRFAAILFSTNNSAFMVFNNVPPGTNLDGIFTAITGFYPIVSNGVNIGAAAASGYPDNAIHGVQPRTAVGLSQDRRYLFLMTIDGRQSNYSDGALDQETAYWLLQFGAWNAINMDGGGSTALYRSDTAGNPIAVNHSSYLAGTGHERYIGSHFGVSAKPLPGAINDVVALPDDTSATITWTTTNASTSLVQYGLTTSLGSSSAYSVAMVTNHAALLSGLRPGTGYYYRVFSSDGLNQYSAGIFFFTTANYATTNIIFNLDNPWTYQTANLDGVRWTAPNFDDSAWPGTGPGLLWVDTSGSPNPNIPVPMPTQMPWNPSTGNPYPTYYLRTHFAFTNNPGQVVLFTTNYLDDGAVFYLNGSEIYRMRMPAAPTLIVNSTLASGYACSNSAYYGNAVCPEGWSVSPTNLLLGDNVLAVEVHNYSAGSPDITFGLALAYTTPYSLPPQLSIQLSNSLLTLSWSRGGFTLQQASSPIGPWANVPGPVVSSPYTTTNSGPPVYYRLIK